MSEGPFTHDFEGHFTHVFEGHLPKPGPVTLTVRIRAKWWKRPWLWLRRRPTSWEHTYENVTFGHHRVDEDGAVAIDFTGDVQEPL